MFRWLLAILFTLTATILIWKLHREKIGQDLHRSKNTIIDVNVIAKVGERDITTQDLQFEMDLQLEGVDIIAVPNLRQEVLAELLERKILFSYIEQDKDFQLDAESCLQKAEDLITSDPVFYQDVNRREKIRQKVCEQDAVYRYGQEFIFADIEVSEPELVSFFHKNPGLFQKAEMVSFRQIVLPDERKAKRIRALVNGKNFSIHAKQSSITPEAENGGLVAPFTKNELPQVFHVLFRMRPGQITGVLKSPYGFHIILLEKKHQAGKLADFRQQVEKKVYKRKRNAAYQKWLEAAMHTVALVIPRS